MIREPQKPQRTLTSQEIDDYERDGVIVLRDILPHEWQDRIEAGVQQLVDNPDPRTYQLSDPDNGFVMDVRRWMVNDDIRDTYFFSPLAPIVQNLMQTHRLNLFFDQVFVKMGGSDVPTAWHQDTPYWPITGHQICSTWIPVGGPVTQESSGMRFVAGSHKWPQMFRANDVQGSSFFTNPDHKPLPDIEANIDDYEIISFDMEPGDVLCFQAHILHGTHGNKRPDMPRKALTLRWAGDDTRYTPTQYTAPYPFVGLPEVGEPFSGRLFPQILPEPIHEEIEERFAGPILADPELEAEIMKRFAPGATDQ